MKRYLAKKDNFYLNYIDLHKKDPLRLMNYNCDASGVKLNCIYYLKNDLKRLRELEPNVKFVNVDDL